MESCLLDWGVKNIFTITVDNASSNDIAIGFIKNKVVNWGGSSTRTEWVKGSPSRLKKFRELADLLEVEEKSSLCLDVPTRWNSTSMMLHTAIAYRQVFETYESSYIVLTLDFGDSVPSYLDWPSVHSLVIFLKTFYEMTIRISGSLYVTSNSFLYEISYLSCIIVDMSQSKSKAEEYISTYSEPSTIMMPPPPAKCENVPVGKVQSRLKSQLKKQKMESGTSLNKKSELKVYLSDSTIDNTNDFNILRWWKVNSERFPILSKLARDVLVVPISTVASESTFSISGRV
ncbi:zinc finger BED domain-containing protein RICESLEEPER 2-like [Cynara cardunculus var. scolymus]|uniref:zinc finger BED domain-containing protein RICESLEEPER 2-like n=1 Tax=Cynara cardunculus var. scolymus TaxID=59895 RepID=UPI000D6269BD|nr:zinc finger BED domain-containing protein RICESLEEPER 2-like [Cynara cardunculus var. scolymus]